MTSIQLAHFFIDRICPFPTSAAYFTLFRLSQSSFMSSFIYVSSQEEFLYKLESIVLWQREHALECHHLGNRLAEEGWRRFQHLPTHTEWRLCVKIMVRVSLTASLTRHIYLCLSVIFGFGLICTDRRSRQQLFPPCYLQRRRHSLVIARRINTKLLRPSSNPPLC